LAAAIEATVTSSTNTCGAISMRPVTGQRRAPAWINAIEAPSLWPTRIGAQGRGRQHRRSTLERLGCM